MARARPEEGQKGSRCERRRIIRDEIRKTMNDLMEKAIAEIKAS
jgi:hypothetical protein